MLLLLLRWRQRWLLLLVLWLGQVRGRLFSAGCGLLLLTS
jgi:hypothetical protein